MKKIYSLTFLFLFAIVVSCADESLDPLSFSSVKKGTILALRGDQLQNIYVSGIPGALFVPGLTDGSETFSFDAEFLSEDPTSIASVDVFVINNVTDERVPLTNVPGSAFKTTSDYLKPWANISIPLADILEKLDYPTTFPIDAATAADMFENYANGITIESDLNLTDGTKVTPSDLVAAGLYASNQFYPAQRLTYTVVRYCPEDLAGTYTFATEVTAVGVDGKIENCVGIITGDGELKKLAGAYGTYSISDVTFGQYDCAWDDDPATGATLINTCDKITVGGSDQYDLIYTFSNIQVSVDGTELSFKWENDYGDKGNTTLTRTDDKTWPAELH